MKKSDFVIIGTILLIAVLFYGINQYRISRINTSILYAEVNVGAEVYERVDMNEEREIIIDTKLGRNVIKVHDGGVQMIEATCPDQVCVRVGHITKPGSTIVCLPNKIHIDIVGDSEDSLDAISE